MPRCPRPVATLLLLLLPLLPAWGAGGGESVLDLARVQDQTLPNGLRVILKSEPYWEAVALGVVIRSGSADETPATSGVAHLVEHLLFEPSAPGKSLSLEVEELGGQVNASTSADCTQITLAVASQFAPDLMHRLAQSVFGAEFTTDAVEAEKAIILQEMQERYAVVTGRAERMIWDLAFTAHPYRLPVPGTPETLSRLTVEQVRDFYRGHYVPENVALIAVGDLDATSFFALARQHFGAAAAHPRARTAPAPEPAQTSPRTKVEITNLNNTLLEFAWQGPGISAPRDVCAMDLIYTALDRGETRLLTRELEGKQLALNTSVEFLTQRWPGLFLVTVVAPPARELDAQQALLKLMARLRDGQVSEEELTYLKRLVYADYAFSNQSYPDQVRSLAFYEAIDTYRFACTYLSVVNSITAADLQAAARKYLREDAYSVVIFRAAAGVEPGEQV